MDPFTAYLEELMDLKRICTIRFRPVTGGVSTIRARITRMEETSGRYMIDTDAGLLIGIDQLIDVNDRVPGNYC